MTRKAARLCLNAHVHASEGIPGEDAGEGFMQQVEVRIAEGTARGNVVLGNWVSDGWLTVGAETFADRLAPLPLAPTTAKVTLRLLGVDFEVMLEGSGIEIRAIGEARYVEEVP